MNITAFLMGLAVVFGYYYHVKQKERNNTKGERS